LDSSPGNGSSRYRGFIVCYTPTVYHSDIQIDKKVAGVYQTEIH
jgi:hypothetical protein